MVASHARKERRRNNGLLKEVVAHESTGSENPRKKFKFGRKEKRTITRHTRRNQGEDEDAMRYRNGEYLSDESEEEENEDEEGSDVEDSATLQTRKAYESLVTLLQHEHQEPDEPKRKKNKKGIVLEKEVVEDEDQEEEDGDYQQEMLDDMSGDSAEEVEDDEHDESADDEDDEDDLKDPFNTHFNDDAKVASMIKKLQQVPLGTKRLKLINKSQTPDYSFLEHVPPVVDESITKKEFNVNSYKVKQKLILLLQERANTPVEKKLCHSMFQYQNVNLQYYEDQDLENSYQELYLLHSLNHIFKTRDKILRNNYKKQNVLEKISRGELKPGDEPEFRDQGYTRPKVLILLPTRNFAYNLVMKIISLLSMDSVENKSKFTKQFYDDFKFDKDSKKSKQFKEFFQGNSNDFFCLGMKFTRKSLKLYSAFDSSDIILASPIGLKMLLDKKPGKDKSGKQKPSNSDYLSSIEILILDKSHGLLMQNWDHVSTILKSMNQVPKSFSELMDFSRIRMWSLDDNARYLTQFLNFSRISTLELNNLINVKSQNLAGSLTVKPVITESALMINKVNRQLSLSGVLSSQTKLKSIFQRFDAETPLEEPNLRFKFFVNVILSQLMNKSSYKNGFLIYVPSYMDYLRLTNYFKQNSKFEIVNIDEYSSQSKLTRSRLLFERQPEKYKIMLYTERLHFYKNYEIKGVKNVVFYALPTDPQYYQDCINFLVRTKLRNDLIVNGIIELRSEVEDENFDLNLSMIRALFSKFDFLKLEKIVGLQKLTLLCNGSNEIYEFR